MGDAASARQRAGAACAGVARAGVAHARFIAPAWRADMKWQSCSFFSASAATLARASLLSSDFLRSASP